MSLHSLRPKAPGIQSNRVESQPPGPSASQPNSPSSSTPLRVPPGPHLEIGPQPPCSVVLSSYGCSWSAQVGVSVPLGPQEGPSPKGPAAV